MTFDEKENNRPLQILKSLFGEPKPIEEAVEPIKFIPLEKGKYNVRVINPVGFTPRSYFGFGSPSNEEIENDSNVISRGGIPRGTMNSISSPPTMQGNWDGDFGTPEQEFPPFLHIHRYERRVLRVVTEPIKYQHRLNFNEQSFTKERWMTYVVDIKTASIKIWTFGAMISGAIEEQMQIHGSTLNDQDIIVWKSGEGRLTRWNLEWGRASHTAVANEGAGLPDLRLLIVQDSNMSPLQN